MEFNCANFHVTSEHWAISLLAQCHSEYIKKDVDVNGQNLTNKHNKYSKYQSLVKENNFNPKRL
ncbi:hypothetical protein [uncultured Tenacibaculum sp.]|uniref:hypothetical protein n=1 Tax=uncultured Tenacibaculum sp. TaxID=174713 RepID=UPI001052089F|nr:hypothetical protein [uncultured Tenacibaculum sp.]TCI93614.1 hypothetical protein EYW44_04170 [Tenacibaculum sp. M341]